MDFNNRKKRIEELENEKKDLTEKLNQMTEFISNYEDTADAVQKVWYIFTSF